jgi:hypothetical protein
VVVGVCALAVAWTAIAAGGSAARLPQQTGQRRLGLTMTLAGLNRELARSLGRRQLPAVSPPTGTIRRPVVPSLSGTSCFVASGEGCSLVPCKGFIAQTGRPDWVPISPECGAQRALPLTPRLSPSLVRSLSGGTLRLSAPKSLRATP